MNVAYPDCAPNSDNPQHK